MSRLARHYRRSPDTLSAEQVQQYLLHLLRERQLLALQRQPVRLRVPLPVRHRARAGRPGVPDPAGAAPQRLPEILSREEIARLFAVRARPAGAHLPDAGLRHRAAPVGAVPPARGATSTATPTACASASCRARARKDRYVPLAADVLELLRAVGAAARPPGVVVRRRARSGRSRCDVTSAQRWYHAARDARGHHQASAASTRCATAMPRTCWRPAWTCTACSSGWATATSAPPRATCTWRGRTLPDGARREPLAAARQRCRPIDRTH